MQSYREMLRLAELLIHAALDRHISHIIAAAPVTLQLLCSKPPTPSPPPPQLKKTPATLVVVLAKYLIENQMSLSAAALKGGIDLLIWFPSVII